MIIQAVFFDMGGTIETYRYTRQLRLEAIAGIRQRLHKAGIHLELGDVELLDLITSGLDRYKRWSIENLEELPPHQVWNDYVLPMYSFDRSKLEEISEDLAFYVETRFYQRAMRPEIPVVLKAIKQMGLKIGLISNVNSRGQVPANLKAYGIFDYFNPIVLSSEYGRRKPDPAIFHYAARLANVPASRCAYVGDRIVRDIDGARRAGFGLALQIRHDFEHGENDEGAEPDAVIESMTELLDILKSRSDEPGAVEETNSIRAILFDAGDVLYDRPGRGERLKAYLADLGLGMQENHAAQKELLTMQAYRGQIDQDQYRAALLRLYGANQPDQIEQGKRILDEEDNNVQFFEGVQQTLLALKGKGYLLGVVTDTANSIHTKLRWFENGGFGHIWDSIISSKELGTRKPDPQIYCAALDQLGVSAVQAVFVGHKASELEGARAVGMKTIAFNYDKDANADYFIEKFADLLKVPIILKITV
jgi:HAD superfamily hydrolase (TIGR01549 family)/HAD superfamily hydrolase (TIGR01509 family)